MPFCDLLSECFKKSPRPFKPISPAPSAKFLKRHSALTNDKAPLDPGFVNAFQEQDVPGDCGFDQRIADVIFPAPRIGDERSCAGIVAEMDISDHFYIPVLDRIFIPKPFYDIGNFLKLINRDDTWLAAASVTVLEDVSEEISVMDTLRSRVEADMIQNPD